MSFGEGPSRDWEDAREHGFISAGGGSWYSETLQHLGPGHRVYAYIPKRNGVGGYVGAGEVTGTARLAKDFMVHVDGKQVPILGIARANGMGDHADDPDLAEHVVPVRWETALPREEAIKDPDFFANQNSAVKLTHAYTQRKLTESFDLEEG